MHENYLLVALSSHGSILIEEKSGTNFFRRVVFDEKVNYGDGWRHWIAYRRDGNEAKLIINGEKQITVERTTESAAESKGNLDISSIMLGYNNSTLAAFEQFKSFVGCISNVILQVDSLEIKPLDWAFTGKNLSQITVRQIKRATCSEPRSLTMIKTMSKKRIKSVLATQNVPEWRPEPSTMVTYSPIIEDIPFLSGSTLITLSIAAGCSAFLIVVLTPMAIYMCYLHRRDKLKKFQLETPFFHSKRRRSKAFPTLTEDEYTVARLLKFQHGRVSRLAHIQTITEEDEQFSDITDDGTSTIATLTDL
ncbi:hypothetical protein HDE_09930 [Halotydeus destructor]|nr:hypothetical protein HDE_09930 [Halotydeus destructor]